MGGDGGEKWRDWTKMMEKNEEMADKGEWRSRGRLGGRVNKLRR